MSTSVDGERRTESSVELSVGICVGQPTREVPAIVDREYRVLGAGYSERDAPEVMAASRALEEDWTTTDSILASRTCMALSCIVWELSVRVFESSVEVLEASADELKARTSELELSLDVMSSRT